MGNPIYTFQSHVLPSLPFALPLSLQSLRPRIIGGLIVDFGATRVELELGLLLLDVVVFNVLLALVESGRVDAGIELETTVFEIDNEAEVLVVASEEEVGGTQGVVDCFESVELELVLSVLELFMMLVTGELGVVKRVEELFAEVRVVWGVVRNVEEVVRALLLLD